MTVFVAWFFARRQVVVPFVEQERRVSITQALEAAVQYDAGEDLETISDRLGRRVERTRRLPRPARGARRGRGPCRAVEGMEYDVIACPPPQAQTFVRSDFGWLAVDSAFDTQEQRRGFGRALAVLALVVMGASAWMAVVLTRPLQATVRAMDRIAGGDLAHRLPEVGSRDLAEVSRAFNRMADRVDRVLTAEREMMAGISHELRTPLARLRLEVELLRAHGMAETRRSAMESDLEEVDRLIGELLMLSRLRIEERQMPRDLLDLKTVAQIAIDRCPVPHRQVELTGEATAVRGDEVRLVRVVTNLLENARKYAPAGSTVHVEVAGRRLTVRDEGPGVPESDLGRLFEPFFRTDRARGAATGSGLGLMIARQVVELHGGTIEARNAPSGGLAITLVLPEPGEAEN